MIFEKDNIEIYINTDDSEKIPHFHFRDKNDWKKLHGCIKIDKCEYFNYGNKQSKLNSSQKKELVNFLKSNCPNTKFNGTNWELLILLWNMNNSDIEVDNNLEMPNYLNLN